MTRNGRIARLPRSIRDELNRRLDEGLPGKRIVAWLNDLPEVREITEAEHTGRPIREQNLSEWRKGGYRDWLDRQEALEIVERLGEDAAEWDATVRPPITDTLALWLAARYAVATRRIADAEGDGEHNWRLLREMCRDLVDLRRGDHSAERLRIERERFDRERERDRRESEAAHWEWAMRDENRERLSQALQEESEKTAKIRAILFGEPTPESLLP